MLAQLDLLELIPPALALALWMIERQGLVHEQLWLIRLTIPALTISEDLSWGDHGSLYAGPFPRARVYVDADGRSRIKVRWESRGVAHFWREQHRPEGSVRGDLVPRETRGIIAIGALVIVPPHPELGGDTVFRAKIRLLPSTLVVPALLIASALLGDSSGRWFTIAFVGVVAVVLVGWALRQARADYHEVTSQVMREAREAAEAARQGREAGA
ncbi:MAG: hypothetical protein H6711_17105 [Myxococcales bacterium]|nr:hypothetical protein [Myxococcales bacterium]